MDNGLIFPYPRAAVPAETMMLSGGADPFGVRLSRGPIG